LLLLLLLLNLRQLCENVARLFVRLDVCDVAVDFSIFIFEIFLRCF